jgi:hypothetical protein
MKYLGSLIFFIYSINVKASGLPVIDAAEEARWLLDLTSAATSITMLTHEFVDEAYFVAELEEIRVMLMEAQEMVNNHNIIASETDNLAGFEISKYHIFKEKVNSLVDLVRGIKSLVVGLKVGVTSRSLSAAVQVMREERQRLHERFEMKLRMAKMKHEARVRNSELLSRLKKRKEILKDYREEEAKKNDWSLRLF